MKRMWKTGKVVAYSSMEDVMHEFEVGHPVSGLYMINTKDFFVRILTNDDLHVLHVIKPNGIAKKRIGMIYKEWVGVEGAKTLLCDEEKMGDHSHCLFLPWLDANNSRGPALSSPHTVVDDNWMHLDHNMQMSLPNFTKWCH